MKKRIYTAKEKAEIALAALKGKNTIAQISSTYEIHSTQINRWKQQAKDGLVNIFSDKRKKENQEYQTKIDLLYKIIGQRNEEIEWLKKKSDFLIKVLNIELRPRFIFQSNFKF